MERGPPNNWGGKIILGSISMFICYFNHLMLTKTMSLRTVKTASKNMRPEMKPSIFPIPKFSPIQSFESKYVHMRLEQML